MADNDDWRSQRAAQLAGTPFARPAPVRIDDTLPISPPRIAVPPRTSAAPPPRLAPAKRSFTLPAIIVLVLAMVVSVFAFFGLRHGADPKIAPVSLAPSPVVHQLPPAVPAPAAVVAPPNVPDAPSNELPVKGAGTAAAPAPASVVQRHSRAAVTSKGSTARHTVQKGKAGKHPRSAFRAATVAPASPAVAESSNAPTTAAIAKLPICQPSVSNRPARKCRPSHTRFVRKPFFDN